MSSTMEKKIRKKRKLKYKKILFLIVLIFFFSVLIFTIFHIRIQNIYVLGTKYLDDETILSYGNLKEYPTVVSTIFTIKGELEKDPRIQEVQVQLKNFNQLYITVQEKKILFYNTTTQKLILEGGQEIEETYESPTLLNYVPDTIYKKFVKKMGKIEPEIIDKISEIKYEPNAQDEERFLLSMTDGNYVYITLSTFDTLNQYFNIMLEMKKKFENKKGILYLDSGKYFEVLEN